MAFFGWSEAHWFTLLQSAGIIGSLIFTAISLRIDAKVRRIGNLINLTEQHRGIWTQTYRRPELVRVLDSKVDLRSKPVTEAEELFVNLLILHLSSVFRAMQEGMFVSPEGLRLDIRRFFSRPIPRAVWEKMKSVHNRDLVRFVESCFD